MSQIEKPKATKNYAYAVVAVAGVIIIGMFVFFMLGLDAVAKKTGDKIREKTIKQ